MRPDDDPFIGLKGSRPAGNEWYAQDDVAFSDLATQRAPGGMYGSWLEDDLQQLFPIGSQPRFPFRVTLEPWNQAAEDAILNSIQGRYGTPNTLADAVLDFASECVIDLLSGPVAIEVETFTDAHGEAQAFKLHVVPERVLSRRRGKAIRFVPAFQSQSVHRGLHYVEVEEARLVRFDLPTAERSTVDRAMKALTAAGQQQFLGVDMLTSGGPMGAFRVDDHNELVNAYLRRETRQLGWDGRNQLVEKMLPPYGVWRALQFARFQVRVRDTIVANLDKAIAMGLGQLGLSTPLRVETEFVEETIAAAERDLEQGTRSLADLTRVAYQMPPRA